VNHPVKCNVCRSASIQGFRYKCQKCSNFNMCQNCFWQGKTSENHRTEHEVKEYSTFVSANYENFSFVSVSLIDATSSSNYKYNLLIRCNGLSSRNRQGKAFEIPFVDPSDAFQLNPRRWIAFLMSLRKFSTYRTLCKEFNNPSAVNQNRVFGRRTLFYGSVPYFSCVIDLSIPDNDMA